MNPHIEFAAVIAAGKPIRPIESFEPQAAAKQKQKPSAGGPAAKVGAAGPFVVRLTIRRTDLLRTEDSNFLTARGSWTNNLGMAQRFKKAAQARAALLRARLRGGKWEIIPESAL